jgi:hypothetical protein
MNNEVELKQNFEPIKMVDYSCINVVNTNEMGKKSGSS